jgi:hypothetical protein
MRFGAAILVGLLLLAFIQFGLMLGGDATRRFAVLVAPLGFLAVLAFSIRFALVGNPTALDRAAAAAVAGLASAALTIVAIVSGMVVFFVGLLSIALVFAGGKEGVAHFFGPVLLWSCGIFAASALVAQGLTYLGVASISRGPKRAGSPSSHPPPWRRP